MAMINIVLSFINHRIKANSDQIFKIIVCNVEIFTIILIDLHIFGAITLYLMKAQ